jgi:GxxExxY protein
MNHELLEKNGKILYREESYQIQGAIFAVYTEMGPGFLESVYQECLEIELRNRGIPFESQKELQIWYKDILLEKHFTADLICNEMIVIELKTVSKLDDIHRAQVFNYLKATGLRLGLLVNFHSHPKVTIERIVL